MIMRTLRLKTFSNGKMLCGKTAIFYLKDKTKTGISSAQSLIKLSVYFFRSAQKLEINKRVKPIPHIEQTHRNMVLP